MADWLAIAANAVSFASAERLVVMLRPAIISLLMIFSVIAWHASLLFFTLDLPPSSFAPHHPSLHYSGINMWHVFSFSAYGVFNVKSSMCVCESVCWVFVAGTNTICEYTTLLATQSHVRLWHTYVVVACGPKVLVRPGGRHSPLLHNLAHVLCRSSCCYNGIPSTLFM